MKILRMHDTTWGHSWDEEFPETPEEASMLCERDGHDYDHSGACRNCPKDVS